jgi:hypothetical protein
LVLSGGIVLASCDRLAQRDDQRWLENVKVWCSVCDTRCGWCCRCDAVRMQVVTGADVIQALSSLPYAKPRDSWYDKPYFEAGEHSSCIMLGTHYCCCAGSHHVEQTLARCKYPDGCVHVLVLLLRSVVRISTTAQEGAHIHQDTCTCWT